MGYRLREQEKGKNTAMEGALPPVGVRLWGSLFLVAEEALGALFCPEWFLDHTCWSSALWEPGRALRGKSAKVRGIHPFPDSSHAASSNLLVTSESSLEMSRSRLLWFREVVTSCAFECPSMQT